MRRSIGAGKPGSTRPRGDGGDGVSPADPPAGPPARRRVARDGRDRQVVAERAAVEAMYRRLDHDLTETLRQRERALAVRPESPGEMYARDLEVDRLTRVIGELRAAERALCFGRVDTTTGTSLHIGRVALRDEGGDLLLIDWRADAARPFYAATAASPLGLRRRRHLRLEGRTVVGVSDELLDGSAPTEEDVVGDGPLVEALGRARTGRMREAVSTLRAEQDAIVRSPSRGVTVVQGGPGTGKTIVALHRAAYVLHAFPRVADRGVLVHGPNHRFLDYIGDVLPSLGENDVRLATAADLVGVKPCATEPAVVAEVKGRADLAEALARWVEARRPHGVPLTVTIGRDTMTMGVSAVDRARRTALRDAPGHNPARERFTEEVVEELVDLMEERAAETLDTIDAEVAEVLGVDPDRVTAADLRRLGVETADTGSGQPGFDRETVRASLLGDPGIDSLVQGVWPRLEAGAVLREFLADRAALASLLPGWTPEERELLAGAPMPGPTTADLALLDEARHLLDGPPEQIFGHIVVDEAQELTGMEWRMLMRRCPSRSMTIVGDFAQAGSNTGIHGWEAALSPFVGDRFETHTLTVNYRTTAEILRASAPLLAEVAPGQRPSRSIRHGAVPRTLGITEAETAGSVDRLIEEERRLHPEGLIGVICPPGRVGDLEAGTSGRNVVVVPADEARGLEFDTVLLVDPAGIRAARPAGARDLYVATTRATTRLTVVEVRPDTAG
ncbi:HelD family protein [Streptomyces alkaliphilus]|uniref:HelD family protein n=1 Tax=Streptomyces alkaliphilus TaxID=1472722 RepID=UPI00117C5CF7|nr:AAA family ATPase [Streptomyces alkaliphilus]MQS08370.1 AAA family ATPase [Streptomyces alkaliphilus]